MNENTKLVLICIIIGCVFSLHNIIGFAQLGGNYSPLQQFKVSPVSVEETQYASGIQTVMNGEIIPTDTQRSDKPTNIGAYPFAAFVIGGVFGLISGSASNALILMDFILPIISFLLCYLFLIRLNVKKELAIIGGAATILISGIIIFFPPFSILDIKMIAKTIFYYASWQRPLEFTRFYAPEVVFPFFIGLMILLYENFKKPTSKKAIASGILFGFFLYLYAFYALLSGIFIALLAAYAIIEDRKELKELPGKNKRLKNFIIMGIIALVIAAPYILNTIESKNAGFQQEFLERAGADFGGGINAIPILKYGLFAIILFLLLKPTKETNPVKKFFALFLAAGIIGANAQLIIGYNVQPFHYDIRALGPIVIILAAYLLSNQLNNKNLENIRKKIITRKALAIIFVALLLYGAVTQTAFGLKNDKYFTINHDEQELSNWFRENTKNTEAYLTLSIRTNTLLRATAPTKTFLPYSLTTSASNSEIMERILLAFKAYRVEFGELEDLLQVNESELAYFDKPTASTNKDDFEKAISSNFFFHGKYWFSPEKQINTKTKYAQQCKTDCYLIPDDELEKMRQQYAAIGENQLFEGKYRIDYVIIGDYEKKIGKQVNYSNLKLVFQNKEYAVYKTK